MAGIWSNMTLKGIKLTWLGHATFRIETPGGNTVIIDPWVMGNPMCPAAEKAVKKVDILLCTHGHGVTNIGDAVEICKTTQPGCGWNTRVGTVAVGKKARS